MKSENRFKNENIIDFTGKQWYGYLPTGFRGKCENICLWSFKITRKFLNPKQYDNTHGHFSFYKKLETKIFVLFTIIDFGLC